MEKPAWLKTCEFKDPEFIKCSTSSIQGLFKTVFDGGYKVPELDSLDPMRIDSIDILQGDGPVSVNASLSKVKITGFSKAVVTESQVSSKDFSWITTCKIPKIRIDADYQMKGRILLIPLNGQGKCFFEPTKMKVKIFTTTKLYAKNGHTFYNVTSVRVNFAMEHVKFRLKNLFPGAKSLDDGVNQFLNDNWKTASEALKPIISKTIEKIMLNFMQKTFHEIPGDYLVSDLPRPEAL